MRQRKTLIHTPTSTLTGGATTSPTNLGCLTEAKVFDPALLETTSLRSLHSLLLCLSKIANGNYTRPIQSLPDFRYCCRGLSCQLCFIIERRRTAKVATRFYHCFQTYLYKYLFCYLLLVHNSIFL